MYEIDASLVSIRSVRRKGRPLTDEEKQARRRTLAAANQARREARPGA